MSSVSSIPLWGQAWELLVYGPGGPSSDPIKMTTSGWEPEALRMTFEVLQSTLPSPWWFAEISIYNADLAALQNVLFHATWVTLRAGFQTGPNLYSQIWDGPVLQVLYTKENVVDQVMHFHCVANPLAEDALQSFAVGEFSTQADLAQRIALSAGLPTMSVANGTLGQKAAAIMESKVYPRGNGVFGKAGSLMGLIARSNNTQSWRDARSLFISEMENPDLTADLIYSPPFPPDAPNSAPLAGVTQSLIGTPRQTPFGVIFTVLLDPRLLVQLPPLVVQLERTNIAFIARIPGDNFVRPISNNLTFFVAQVRHTGDTRGNEWNTEVTGYTTTYGTNLLNGFFAAGAGQ